MEKTNWQNVTQLSDLLTVAINAASKAKQAGDDSSAEKYASAGAAILAAIERESPDVAKRIEALLQAGALELIKR